MEYLTCISIPTPDVEFYGRPVGDLVCKGARLQADGIVKGRFPYVSGYTGFSNDDGATEGHYFPARVNVTGKTLEIVRCKDGKTFTGDMSKGDDFVVIRIDDNKEYDIKVDGRKICHLDFSEAVLEDKKGANKMNVDFFDPGVCGIPLTGHIGSLNKDNAKDTNAITFEKAIPTGTKLVNIITVSSADMAGAATVTVGNSAQEDVYSSECTATAGKTVVTDAKYADVTSGTIKLKVDTAVSAGTIDVFATVIRLAV